MSRLKISAIEDDTPVKLALEVPAATYRDLVEYAKLMSAENGGKAIEPAKVAPEMMRRFMASDRGFVRGRKPRGA